MDETITYLDFPYPTLTHYAPPGHAGSLFYEGLLDRYRANTKITVCPNPNLEPCWNWVGNPSQLISHKHEGMVQIKRLAFALYLPHEYNFFADLYRKRIRTSVHYRCSNKLCVRPDHMITKESTTYIHWTTLPHKRGRRDRNDDELKYPEIKYITAYMRIGMGDPSEQLVRLSERLKIPYLSLITGWTNIQGMLQREFDSYSLYQGKL